MKKEDLEKRIEQLNILKEQYIAEANGCQGAINELKRLILELDNTKSENDK